MISARDNYKLDPSTSYWIVIERASLEAEPCAFHPRAPTGGRHRLRGGWSIGDDGSNLSGGTWSATTRILLIAVKGRAANSHDVGERRRHGRDVERPGAVRFQLRRGHVESGFRRRRHVLYRAVANAHTDGELEATPNDSNATVEFLDENDATITTVTQTGNVHSILPPLTSARTSSRSR